jgi:6-pyruvoyltetrahydropterin/6-carboxytetrahydropterin synthase
MKVTVCRKEHFNAAHRLHNPLWTDKRNQDEFGKCNLPNYHGHNYNLEVKVTGEIDQESGYVIDMKILKEVIRKKVTEKFDHRNLNIDIEDFRTLNPTAENIAVVIWKILRAELEPSLELKIVLYETERNFVEYDGA